MYQVLIADDELSVLKSLMDGIQWEELAYRSCGCKQWRGSFADPEDRGN